MPDLLKQKKNLVIKNITHYFLIQNSIFLFTLGMFNL